MVINALGNVVDPDSGEPIAGARSPETGEIVSATEALLQGGTATNTTIGVVATDADLTPVEVQRMAAAAHDGLAAAIRPVHTLYDGDVMFGLATGARGRADIHPVALHVAVVDVVARAIVNAVRSAVSAGGLPAARDLRPGAWA
jgi:L-aminopeptidase/D-esterase-like protein